RAGTAASGDCTVFRTMSAVPGLACAYELPAMMSAPRRGIKAGRLSEPSQPIQPPGQDRRRQQGVAALPRRRRDPHAAVALDLPEHVVQRSLEGEGSFDQPQQVEELADDPSPSPSPSLC